MRLVTGSGSPLSTTETIPNVVPAPTPVVVGEGVHAEAARRLRIGSDGERAIPWRVPRSWREDLAPANLSAEGLGERLEVHRDTSAAWLPRARAGARFRCPRLTAGVLSVRLAPTHASR